MPGDAPYRIESDDPRDWKVEINNIFAFIYTRISKLEGRQGDSKFYGNVITENDLIIDENSKGVIFKDNQDPARYWRLNITATGTSPTINLTYLGPSY